MHGIHMLLKTRRQCQQKNMTDAIGGHSHLYVLGASHEVALLLSTSFGAAYASDNLKKF